ncbi:MAG: hypothetical protein HYY38_02225 [Rhodospirillales bacterium]|nr:hypothetical protein [Rhodospirillales bacterium]
MAEHRKEGRLSEDEAHEDIERLNVAAREANLPLLDDLSRIEDVRALEQMLEDAGLYTGPTVSDAIELGSQVSLDILASQARDKEPLEIHYQERIIEAVRSMFRERFGMDVPPFPTERIFLLEDAMFDRVVEQRSATFFPAHEPKMIHGLFDSRNAIILVRHRECDPLAERLQVTAHELTHWALHAQPRHNTASLLAFAFDPDLILRPRRPAFPEW